MSGYYKNMTLHRESVSGIGKRKVRGKLAGRTVEGFDDLTSLDMTDDNTVVKRRQSQTGARAEVSALNKQHVIWFITCVFYSNWINLQ